MHGIGKRDSVMPTSTINTCLSSSERKVTKHQLFLGPILTLTGFSPRPLKRFFTCWV